MATNHYESVVAAEGRDGLLESMSPSRSHYRHVVDSVAELPTVSFEEANKVDVLDTDLVSVLEPLSPF
jgi:hypothetical protein